MATRTILVDDLDKSPNARTVQFAVDGDQFEIDLSPRNITALKKALAPYVRVARRAGTTPADVSAAADNGAADTGSAARSGRGGRRASRGPAGRASSSRRRAAAKLDVRAVREWAAANGHAVSSRGRIPSAVLDAYQAAQQLAGAVASQVTAVAAPTTPAATKSTATKSTPATKKTATRKTTAAKKATAATKTTAAKKSTATRKSTAARKTPAATTSTAAKRTARSKAAPSRAAAAPAVAGDAGTDSSSAS